MTNYNFIEASEKSLKNVAKEVRGGNVVYTSLSQVLKDIQRSDLMKAGYKAAFAGLGVAIDENKKFAAADFFCLMQEAQYKAVTVGKGKEKKEVKKLGLWGWSQMKDADGNKLFEEDGVTPKMEAVLRVVTAWTPNKVFKAIAQAKAIKVQK